MYLTGGPEAVALIKGARRRRPDHVRDQKHPGIGTRADGLNHKGESSSAVAATLKSMVDEQPPKVVRPDVLRLVDSDAVADHHETHGLGVGVPGSVPGLRIGKLRGLNQGLRDA